MDPHLVRWMRDVEVLLWTTSSGKRLRLVGGGGRRLMGGMGWRTEDAGVSPLVERYFWRPWSMNGESDGWVGTMFQSRTRLFLAFLNRWDALV